MEKANDPWYNRVVLDENNLRVAPDDSDYMEQRFAEDAQRAWEKRQLQEQLRLIEAAAVRVAQAIELGCLSPEATERIRRALKMNVSNSPRGYDEWADVYEGPSLRRFAAAAGQDLDAIRRAEEYTDLEDAFLRRNGGNQ